jgi:hypothetical protein
MHRANGAERRSVPGSCVCEDCRTVRAPDEAGWVRVWLDEKHQPPIMLTYCPRCAEQFDAYPEDVSPIDGR